MADKEGTKGRILEATLSLVGERGFEGLTVRAIASRARVGVAAVNYHFGSKDEAVAEAFGYITEDFRKAFEPLSKVLGPGEMAPRPEAPSLEAAAAIEAFALAFAEAVLKHGPALAFFVGGMGSGGRPAPAAYREFVMDEGLPLAGKVLGMVVPGLDAEEVAMRLSALAGALLYPAIVPRPLGLDLRDEGRLRRYANQLASSFMAAGMPGGREEGA